MQLQRFESTKEFWQAAQGYLLQDEAVHNALLGILQTLLHNPERYLEPPYLAMVQTDATNVGAAIRTPPGPLLLSQAQDLSALQVIAQDLQQESLSGVGGPVAEVEAFVQAWQTLTGQSYRRQMESRIYQLTAVQPGPPVKGQLRQATEADRALLFQWFTDFDSAIGIVAPEETELRLNLRLEQQSLYLWEADAPVCMVGGRQFSATSARIAPVYTPPEHRRNGYATAAVAALSQKLLDEGSERCFLFTDLANPTSNHIYQQVGYRPVCDWHEYALFQKE